MTKKTTERGASRRIAVSSMIACAGAFALLMPASAADTIPNFAPDSNIAWVAFAQDFAAPPSGPGPILGDPAHKPRPGRPAFRVADLSNPILQPWSREELRKAKRLLDHAGPFRIEMHHAAAERRRGLLERFRIERNVKLIRR